MSFAHCWGGHRLTLQPLQKGIVRARFSLYPSLHRFPSPLQQQHYHAQVRRRTIMTTTTTTQQQARSNVVVETCEMSITPPSMYTTSPPAHHSSSDVKSRVFRSPWPSAGQDASGFLAFFRARMTEWEDNPPPPEKDRLQPQPVTWRAAEGSDASDHENAQIRATWLAHAACHFQIPMPRSMADAKRPVDARRVTVLTDPVFSKRCSPSQLLGPARFQPSPTSVEEMAKTDVTGVWPDLLVISHNHYDHLDEPTMRAFLQRPHGKPLPHVFCTLGVKRFFMDLGYPEAGVTELDWWQQRQISWDNGQRKLKLTCVPAQHFSSRSLFDRNKTLWAGWTMEAIGSSSSSMSSQPQAEEQERGKKIYFAGDSGYRAVSREQIDSGHADEDSLPYCPAFEEIGSLLGPFDVAAIPIGAYRPRSMMSQIHMNAREAVHVHCQVRAKHSIAIHWATFPLTCEKYFEPREMLKDELQKQNYKEDAFVTPNIGQTLLY